MLFKPQHANNDLENPNCNHNKPQLSSIVLIKTIETISKKYDRTNDRLQDIIGKCHFANATQWSEILIDKEFLKQAIEQKNVSN